ncbi:MFS transporter [candidate division KSB1 bacterium]|nr:MFS transporter [candidate division KSB1 bacterium]
MDASKPRRLTTFSWILYDFANTIYSMNVVTMYFSTWIVVDLGRGDRVVGTANSLSMIFVALTLPILGEISDRFQRRMPFLFIYTLACVLATIGIGVIGQTGLDIGIKILWAVLLYIVANYAYQGGLVFYNSLLPYVCTPRSIGRVSGYGVALGYFGSIFGLIIALPFVEGSLYGLKIPFIEAGGSVAAFVPSGLLFMVFAIPIFIFVKDPASTSSQFNHTINIKESFSKVWDSLSNTRKYPGVTRFLVAKYFYEDAIQTIIIFMAVYAQKVMGFSKGETTTFFIIVIPFAIIGSALCGIVTDHFGPKKTLMIVLFGWIIALSLLIMTMNITVFWILSASVGIFMGSTWTAARPLLISLVPQKMLGEFFGLYSFSGKLAAIAGPLIWSVVVDVFNDRGDVFKYKAAIFSLLILMLIGIWILRKVPNIWSKENILVE